MDKGHFNAQLAKNVASATTQRRRAGRECGMQGVILKVVENAPGKVSSQVHAVLLHRLQRLVDVFL